jgi:LmbE family N-acetylglucosaminyl deacetylase
MTTPSYDSETSRSQLQALGNTTSTPHGQPPGTPLPNIGPTEDMSVVTGFQRESTEVDYGPRVLFIGAHCDDIEIGCGGTAAKLSALGCEISFAIASDSGPHRKDEAKEAAAKLGLTEENGRVLFGNIPDRYLDQEKDELQRWFEELKRIRQPDTVFVHHKDNNPDHETVFTVAIRCFNEQTVLQYYIPQLDTRRTSFSPNVTEDITDHIATKLAMCACHKSQSDKPIYLDPEVLKANALVFFVEAHATPKSLKKFGYAEAFRVQVLRRPRSSHRDLIPAASFDMGEKRADVLSKKRSKNRATRGGRELPSPARPTEVRIYDSWHDTDIQNIISSAQKSIEIIDSHYDEATDLVPMVSRALKKTKHPLEISVHMLDPAKPFGAQRLLEKTGHQVRVSKHFKEFERLYARTFAEDCKRLRESFAANSSIREAKDRVRLKIYTYPTMPGDRIIAVDDSIFIVGSFPLNDTNPNYPCSVFSSFSCSTVDREIIKRLRLQIEEIHQDRTEVELPPAVGIN